MASAEDYAELLSALGLLPHTDELLSLEERARRLPLSVNVDDRRREDYDLQASMERNDFLKRLIAPDFVMSRMGASDVWGNEDITRVSKGGNQADLPLRAFAEGGRAPAGEQILVGENGPEVIQLDRPGTVVPNNALFVKDAQGRKHYLSDQPTLEQDQLVPPPETPLRAEHVPRFLGMLGAGMVENLLTLPKRLLEESERGRTTGEYTGEAPADLAMLTWGAQPGMRSALPTNTLGIFGGNARRTVAPRPPSHPTEVALRAIREALGEGDARRVQTPRPQASADSTEDALRAIRSALELHPDYVPPTPAPRAAPSGSGAPSSEALQGINALAGPMPMREVNALTSGSTQPRQLRGGLSLEPAEGRGAWAGEGRGDFSVNREGREVAQLTRNNDGSYHIGTPSGFGVTVPSKEEAIRRLERMPNISPEAADARRLAANPGMSLSELAGVREAPRRMPSEQELARDWRNTRGFGHQHGIEWDRTSSDLFNKHIASVRDLPTFTREMFAGTHDPRGSRAASSNPSSFTIDAPLITPEGQDMGYARRTINVPAGYAKHDYFKLSPKFRGTGIADDILRNQVKIYKDLGLDHVKVDAAGSGNLYGSYVWPKYGFTPSAGEWTRIRQEIFHRLDNVHPELDPGDVRRLSQILRSDDPRSIWELSDMKGRNLPADATKAEDTLGKYMLSGNGWSGKLDLLDLEAMERFDARVNRKR